MGKAPRRVGVEEKAKEWGAGRVLGEVGKGAASAPLRSASVPSASARFPIASGNPVPI